MKYGYFVWKPHVAPHLLPAGMWSRLDRAGQEQMSQDFTMTGPSDIWLSLAAFLFCVVVSTGGDPTPFPGCVEDWPGVEISDQLSGTISFPEGDNYVRDKSCFWTINAPPGKVIRYAFSFFNVIPGYESLFVWSSEWSRPTGPLNNNAGYYDLATEGLTTVTVANRLKLNLQSISSKDAEDDLGFVLNWEVVDPECTSGDSGGEYVKTTGSGSLDYPLNHDVHGNLGGNCLWTITAPIGKIIKWKVDSLAVVYYDYLLAYSFDDEINKESYKMWNGTDLYAAYSFDKESGMEGDYTADGSFVTLGNVLYLYLKLDLGINDEGFDISWEIYDVSCRECLITKGSCEDFDTDGTADTCTCPEPFSSSDFSLGCDQNSSSTAGPTWETFPGCVESPPGLVVSDQMSGTIDWPEGEGTTYPHDLDCYWTIYAPEGKVIRYSFSFFDIPGWYPYGDGDYYWGDYLQVNKASSVNNRLDYYDLATTGLTSVTASNRLTLDLDGENTSNDYYEGFILDWEVVDSECTGVEDGGEMITTTGSGSLDYPLNHDVHGNLGGFCLWTITAPTGKIIMWKVNSLDLVYYDELIGYSYYENGARRSYFMWSDVSWYASYYYEETWGGEGAFTADGSFVTLDNALYLYVYLDYYINEEGFDISWEVYDESCRKCLMTKGSCEDFDTDGTADTCTCPEPFSSSAFSQGCDQDSSCDPVFPGIVIDDAVSGTLDWPEGINMYRESLHCFWKIVVQEGMVIRYSFSAQSIEPYDYLFLSGTGNTMDFTSYNMHESQYGVMGDTTVTQHNELLLEFDADSIEYYSTYSVTPDRLHDRRWARYGFVIDWEQADSECNDTYPGMELKADAGGLDYPVNHDRYSHFMGLCYWMITAPSDKIFVFQFDKLDVEYYYDGLVAYDYYGEFYRIFNTGDYTSPTSKITADGQWVTETNELVFAMYSDYTYHFTGFTVNWRLADSTCYHCLRFLGTCDDSDSDGTVDTCTCPSPYSSSSVENGCDQITGCTGTKPGVVIDGNPSGSLEWPPGSNTEYVRNMECYWQINAPSGKVLRYQFSQLSVEAADYLYVRNGGGMSRTNYWYLGETLDSTTVTLDNFLKIEFHSDEYDYYHRYYELNFWDSGYYFQRYEYEDAPDLAWTRFGFTVEWEVVEPECSTAVPGIEIDGESVSSLDYPTGHDKYAPFMDNCYWKLVAPEGMAFKFNFTMFDVETDTDYLMVFSDDDFSSSPDFMFSGSSIPTDDSGDTYFTSLSNVMNLAMYSNYEGNYTGFVLEWVLIPGLPCPRCERSGGACYDGNMDGELDACLCPLQRCASTLDAGCDTDCVLVNSVCDPSSVAPCWDYNAHCVLRDLSGKYVCDCKFGYVQVNEDGEPVRCHRRLTAFHDTSCEACLQNGGACYDLADARDNVMDGCQCPPTRASDSAPCDTPLFTVECTETEMTVCYVPNSLPGHADVADKLINDEYVLFITGFYNELGCHLTRSGDNFCIDLTYGSPTAECGLLTQDSYRSLTYSSAVCLQKSPYQQTANDMRLFAYCTYDKILGIGSGVLDVAGTKRVGSEGEKHVADIGMLILNDADEDLRTIGLITGDLIKLRLSITDDAGGLFTSLRAEVCVLSDRLSLAHPNAKAVPVVLDGCPEPPLLDAADNFGAINGDMTLQETGLFISPKFPESSYLFAHCAVRVCMDDTNCQPYTCSQPERRKRSVVTRVRQAMESLMLDPNVQQQVIQIRYISRTGNLTGTPARQDVAAAAGSIPELLIWISAGASILILVVTFSILFYLHASRVRTASFQL